jgi:DNA repair protein RadC
MKFTDEEQQIIRRAEAIISAKLPGTDYLTSPDMVRSFLRLHFASADRELFGVLFLDSQNGVIAFEELFQGALIPAQYTSASLSKKRCSITPAVSFWPIIILHLILCRALLIRR